MFFERISQRVFRLDFAAGFSARKPFLSRLSRTLSLLRLCVTLFLRTDDWGVAASVRLRQPPDDAFIFRPLMNIDLVFSVLVVSLCYFVCASMHSQTVFIQQQASQSQLYSEWDQNPFVFLGTILQQPLFLCISYMYVSGWCALFVWAWETQMIWLEFSSFSLWSAWIFFSHSLPRAWSTVLYTNAKLFCFTGSHLAKPHKHSLMQFLSAFFSQSFDVQCNSLHCISLSLKKMEAFTSQMKTNENLHFMIV